MRARLSVVSMVLLLAAPIGSVAQVVPEAVPDLPVLGGQAHRGNNLITTPAEPIDPAPKTVDGQIDDWIGQSPMFGGTAIYSAGEYVYQDYINDDWGADDGIDAERVQITDTLNELEPRTYRAEALPQAAGAQFGAPPPVGVPVQYGDAVFPGGLRDQADIAEVRIAADDERVYVLVRTTGMTTIDATAVLVLIDTPADAITQAPGGVTTNAELAILAIDDQATFYELGEPVACGCVQAKTNDEGFINAVELSVERASLPAGDELTLAVATGVSVDGVTIADVRPDGAASDLINVAFRFDEPARIRMDHDQALALREGTIDEFFVTVDLGKLQDGYTESFEPRPGYYERVYISDSPVVREVESNGHWQGIHQHYGIYFPTSYRPGNPTPATWWTHYRGGHAHDAAAWVPGLIRQLGEQRGNIVITPSARGRSSWYVGRGHEDFLEAWDDSMASFPIDPNRVYMSGYSMGGYASWLLPLLYPDRFAASFPTAGPPTQGLWDGVGLVIAGTDDGRPQEQLTFDIIGNAANLGYVIYHGSSDELVPVTGAIRMASELALLGNEHRLYVFPGAEHYTNAIYDEWTEAARYLDRFVRDPDPPRVVYSLKPALVKAVEEVRSDDVPLSYGIHGAYWVSGMLLRDGGDGEDATAIGTIDATTFGRGLNEHIGVPEAGTGGQIMPHVMTGLRRVHTGFVEPSNAAEVSLTNLSRARLDMARMGLSTNQPLAISVQTDGEATLELDGAWAGLPLPSVTGADAWGMIPGRLFLEFDGPGTYTVTITP